MPKNIYLIYKHTTPGIVWHILSFDLITFWINIMCLYNNRLNMMGVGAVLFDCVLLN